MLISRLKRCLWKPIVAYSVCRHFFYKRNVYLYICNMHMYEFVIGILVPHVFKSPLRHPRQTQTRFYTSSLQVQVQQLWVWHQVYKQHYQLVTLDFLFKYNYNEFTNVMSKANWEELHRKWLIKLQVVSNWHNEKMNVEST